MNKKIFIAGHNGMVGNAVLRKFIDKKNYKIITIDKKKLNLLDQNKVYNYLSKNKFHSVIICAARAGGIYANNTFKTNFIFENLQIQNNLIYGSHLSNVKINLSWLFVYLSQKFKTTNERGRFTIWLSRAN